ncbi:hypothetical protein D3C81_540200 [compost metagenome]
MLGDHEAPAEGFVDQADAGLRAQAVALQTQQADGAAVEVFAQRLYQTLQAHSIGQLDDQVGGQAFTQHGSHHPLWLSLP